MTPARRRASGNIAMVAVVGVLLGSLVNRYTMAPPTSRLINEASGSDTRTTTMEMEGDIDLGPTPRDEVIDFGVVLRKAHPKHLKAFLAALHDPSSPDFRKFLTPDEFGRRFGPSDAGIAEVTAWLDGRGFDVGVAPPQRTSLAVRGTVGAVNDAFGITMHDWVDEQGRPFRAPDRQPLIPAPIRAHVTVVAPLDTRPEESASTPVLLALPGGYLQPAHVARAFEIEELHARNILGQGQSIGIISFDTFDDADVAAFDRETDTAGRAGADPLPVQRVRLPNAATEPGADESEVNLDIDVIRTIAPAAQIINYEAPNGPGYVALVKEIVARQEVDIVSISYGRCERKKLAERIAAEDVEFEAAAASGISFFISSGDHGAHGCRFFPLPETNPQYRDLSLSVSSPGSEYLISVGGTYLTVGSDGSYVAEVGWEDPLTGWATGGGVSTVYPRPVWQVGVGVENEFSTGKRQVPDVAGPGDSDSGWLTVYTAASDTEPTRHISGGTSASAPFWAASMLLVRQLAEDEGVHAPGFGRLGALGPLLYQLADAAEPGALFHDVVRGGNLYHNAGVGWDYATGLGSPRVGPLARAIVDSLR